MQALLLELTLRLGQDSINNKIALNETAVRLTLSSIKFRHLLANFNTLRSDIPSFLEISSAIKFSPHLSAKAQTTLSLT